MFTYYDLVQYTKDNHINWNTELFEVLRGFFENTSIKASTTSVSTSPIEIPTTDIIGAERAFIEPSDGEYTTQDLLNLFSS